MYTVIRETQRCRSIGSWDHTRSPHWLNLVMWLERGSSGNGVKYTGGHPHCYRWIDMALVPSEMELFLTIMKTNLVLFFWKRLYLFIHERHKERGRDIGRERSRLPPGSLMRDSIPGPQNHNLSQRQMLNHWATQTSHKHFLLKVFLFCFMDAHNLFHHPPFWYLCYFQFSLFIYKNAS